ncbi:PIN domain-containing protein [Kitasatospora sp. NPDC002040]|uniref:type II toxin-antitoxin system VapC family toxin n=1 Tax=Kitasatospora sp. NPDC002040 TaxID=3154661 RepID=UPI00331AB32B
MIIVVADTSGLLAALDATHPLGASAREVLRTAGTLVISPVLLAELDHLARRILGPQAAHAAVDDIRRWVRAGRAVLPEITADTLDTAQAVRLRHAALGLDLADAVNVALAAEFRTDCVLTLDQRDFRAISPLTVHQAFRILPHDL